MSAAAGVRLAGVTKRYGDRLALDGLDLQAAPGELLALLGPSGSGKSTALRVVAGLEPPTAGRVEVAGRDVTRLAPHRRDVAVVFQDAALFPHLSVRENLGFGPAVRRVPAPEARRRVAEVADLLGLAALLDARPEQLSGGERQRVALARALVREPSAFLLDEPLSALDPALREEARALVLALHRRLGATTLLVTHDPREAMTLGDRVAVLVAGCLQQVGGPQEVYDAPASLVVARLLGPLSAVPGGGPLGGAPGTVVGVRPEDVLLDPEGPLPARVVRNEPVGSAALLHLAVGDDAALLAQVPARGPHREGDAVRVRVARRSVFDAATGARQP